MQADADADPGAQRVAEAVDGVAGIDEGGNAPARADAAVDFQAAHQQVASAFHLVLGVAGTQLLELVATHALVAAGEEALRGRHLVKGISEGGAGLAAQQQAAGVAQRQDVLAAQPPLGEVDVRTQRLGGAQQLQVQPPAVAGEQRVVGVTALPVGVGQCDQAAAAFAAHLKILVFDREAEGLGPARAQAGACGAEFEDAAVAVVGVLGFAAGAERQVLAGRIGQRIRYSASADWSCWAMRASRPRRWPLRLTTRLWRADTRAPVSVVMPMPKR